MRIRRNKFHVHQCQAQWDVEVWHTDIITPQLALPVLAFKLHILNPRNARNSFSLLLLTCCRWQPHAPVCPVAGSRHRSWWGQSCDHWRAGAWCSWAAVTIQGGQQSLQRASCWDQMTLDPNVTPDTCLNWDGDRGESVGMSVEARAGVLREHRVKCHKYYGFRK